jgi:ABC-2 type transport system permease protein
VKNDIKEFFIIPADYVSTGLLQRYSIGRELEIPPPKLAAIRSFLTDNLLAGKVSDQVIARVEASPALVTTTLTSEGVAAPEQGGFAGFVVPGIFGLLLALAIIFSSTYVLQGLSEEKESRLMEILLSSISTRQLVIGKVLGIGAAGLLQVVVWVAMAPLLLNMASSSFGGFLATIRIPGGFLALAVVYFILGYLLFAILSAGVAAVSTSVREAQGLAGVITMFAVAPFWFLSLIMIMPESPAWVVLSIFPLTAPVLMMLRMGLTGVPAWQLMVSILVMGVTVVGGLLLVAKLLRTYILMYGKRPTLGEIFRSLKAG